MNQIMFLASTPQYELRNWTAYVILDLLSSPQKQIFSSYSNHFADTFFYKSYSLTLVLNFLYGVQKKKKFTTSLP